MNHYTIWLKDSNREVYVSAETRSEAVDKVLAAFENGQRVKDAATGVVMWIGLSNADKKWLEEARTADIAYEDHEPPYTKAEITDDVLALAKAVEGAYDMIYIDMCLHQLAGKARWYTENIGEN